jgi:translation initiation factor IF-1
LKGEEKQKPSEATTDRTGGEKRVSGVCVHADLRKEPTVFARVHYLIGVFCFAEENMVKNTSGGNRSKAMGRKYATAKSAKELRLSTCELEQYGTITRVLGNGMFYISTTHHSQLLGHIRNKFRGRFKRDNTVAVGVLALVGLREWEAPTYKECDLLEVYDSSETRQLLNNASLDLESLRLQMVALTAHRSTDESGSAGAAAAAAADADIDFCDSDPFVEDDTAAAKAAAAAAAASSSSSSAAYMRDVVDIDDI